MDFFRKVIILTEKLKAEGVEYPATTATRQLLKEVENKEHNKEHYQPLDKEQYWQTKERKTSTERVKAWRLRNAEKNKEQTRKAQAKFKDKKARIEH